MRRFHRLALFALPLAAACGGSELGGGAGNTPTGGTVIIATTEPDNLCPPISVSLASKEVMDQIYEHLAEIGDSLNAIGDAGFRPRLASSWTWSRDSLSIAFHLNPAARWHDGVPVRAADVRFTLELYKDPATNAFNSDDLSDIDSVSTPDSLTAVFWFHKRQPTQFFAATYQLFILPQHVLGTVKRSDLKFSRCGTDPVGTGRFRMGRWVKSQQLEVVADTGNYRGRPRLDRIVWAAIPDATAAVTKLLAGEADIYEALRPENLKQLADHPEIAALPYRGMDYAFLQFNLRDPKAPSRPNPLFADRAARRALTMALDRTALVRAAFDTLAWVPLGPFPRSLFTADTSLRQIPFDSAGAARTLDSLGWKDTNGDGIRDRDGKPFEFTVLVPSVSQNRVIISVFVQEQFRRLGIKADLQQLDFNTFLQRESDGQFDAVLGGWHTDPSPTSIRQTWSGEGLVSAGGTNYGSWVNPTFDALIDSAVASMDGRRALTYYRRAYQVSNDDPPAVWLYEPRFIAGISRRIHTTGVRDDAWWADMADWYILPADRIARDKIGLAVDSAAPH